LLLRWNWLPPTFVEWCQALAWLVLAVALLPLVRRGLSLRDRPAVRALALIGIVGLAARLSVPHLPFNWHSGVANVDLGGPIYSKQTTYMPLPDQLMTFVFGFRGILWFNIVTNVLTAMGALHVTRRSGYSQTVALLVGLGLAITPMYVRLSASDSSHILALPLWWLTAYATQRLIAGDGGRLEQAILLTAAMVSCPIRIEAGLVLPSVFVFVARDWSGLIGVWQARRRLYPFAVGWVAGMACNVAVHRQDWTYRLGSPDPLLFVVQMVFRCLFLAAASPDGWIPIVYVLLIWFYLYDTWRRGDGQEFLATVLPYVIFSIPFAYSMTGIAMELPSTAYSVTINMFLLLSAAKGAELLWDRWRAHRQPRRPNVRRMIAVTVASITVVGFVATYRQTYAYMMEFDFLQKHLPRQKARILTIWDPSLPGGDYDCCLALPYPTFIGDFPELEWQVLRLDDAAPGHLEGLNFDYYYPGSLVEIDVDEVNPWFSRVSPDSGTNAAQQEPLRKLQSIDRFVRRSYPMQVSSTATLPAVTFSGARFHDDVMTLTLYRASATAGHRE